MSHAVDRALDWLGFIPGLGQARRPVNDIGCSKGSDLLAHVRDEHLLRLHGTTRALALLRESHKRVDRLALHIVGNPVDTNLSLRIRSHCVGATLQ